MSPLGDPHIPARPMCIQIFDDYDRSSGPTVKMAAIAQPLLECLEWYIDVVMYAKPRESLYILKKPSVLLD